MTDEEYDFEWGRNAKEYVICAANWHQDSKEYTHQPRNIKTGFVVCARRHHNAFMTASILGANFKEDGVEIEQGFLTSHDRWLTRKEAAELALKIGQIKNETPMLFSEDIY